MRRLAPPTVIVPGQADVLRYGAGLSYEEQYRAGLLPRIGGAAGPSLVGSVGVLSQSASAGAAPAPAFGTGEGRAAKNLLIAWAIAFGTTTLPSISTAGWNTAVSHTNGATTGGCTGAIFWRLAVGSDSAPTFNAISGVTQRAQLAEFTGTQNGGTPTDEPGNNGGTTSPLVATAAAADAFVGDLVIYLGNAFHSATQTAAVGSSLNNGATATDTFASSGSASDETVFGYGVPTSRAAANAFTFTFVNSRVNSAVAILASFRPSDSHAALQRRGPQRVVNRPLQSGRF